MEGCQKAALRRRAASLRDIRRYSIGVSSAKALSFTAQGGWFLGDGGRLCQACSRIETIRFHLTSRGEASGL